MATTRTHIVLPEKLLNQLDKIVGPRERSAYIAEAVADRIQRDKLLNFLETAPPLPDAAWDPKLIKLGSAEWVRKLRREPSPRSAKIAKRLATNK